MKRRTASPLTVLAVALGGMALVAAACGGEPEGSGGDQTYTWRLGETHPKEYPTTQADIWFADELRERSNGRIDIEVFASAQLGEERAVLEQVQLGATELTRVSAGPMSEFVDSWGMFNLPYLFDDEDHLWSFLSGDHGRQMLADLRKGDFIGLAYYDAGARNFYTVKEPITSPADLKGKNFRVILSDVNVDMIEAMGGSATPMDFGEVYSSLETGVIDGAENNEPSFISAGHYEVAKYYTRDAHQRVPEVLLINTGIWDGLSDADRQLIRKVATESVDVQRDLWAKEVERSIKKMKEAGITINEVNVQEFQDAVAPMLETYGEQFPAGLAAVDEARGQ